MCIFISTHIQCILRYWSLALLFTLLCSCWINMYRISKPLSCVILYMSLYYNVYISDNALLVHVFWSTQRNLQRAYKHYTTYLTECILMGYCSMKFDMFASCSVTPYIPYSISQSNVRQCTDVHTVYVCGEYVYTNWGVSLSLTFQRWSLTEPKQETVSSVSIYVSC